MEKYCLQVDEHMELNLTHAFALVGKSISASDRALSMLHSQIVGAMHLSATIHVVLHDVGIVPNILTPCAPSLERWLSSCNGCSARRQID